MPISSIQEGNPLNKAGGSSISNKSNFVFKFPIPGTYRFGEYSPCFVAETLADDDLRSVHVGHEVISSNLKAPLLQEVLLRKDFFWVPDMAILPRNWEKFFVNPVKGEDVPIDVGCGVTNFTKKIGAFFNAWKSYISTLDVYDATVRPLVVQHIIKWCICAEQFYTEGCLMATMRYNMSQLFEYEDDNGVHDFAFFFDHVFELIRTYGISLQTSDGRTHTLSANSSISDARSYLCNLRDRYDWTVTNNVKADLTTALAQSITACSIDAIFEKPYNLRRVLAYQLACAHFYTNDKIDYVYTAELYRQLVYSTFYETMHIEGDPEVETFQVNGLTYEYDYLSAHYFDVFIQGATTNPEELAYNESYRFFLDYLRLIFGFNYSLRYADYFTGSRSQPLAVGDVNVAVNNNMVNVVNVAAKTMAAKMLNVANRIGQRVEAYVKEFFHIEMAKDYHNPFWLMQTKDVIGNPETQNTGAAQQTDANTITSIFRTSGLSEGFDMLSDRAGIVIGIQYFDIQRIYPHGMDRQYFHLDRFDDFLPYLQYVGDQDIQTAELDNSNIARRDPDGIFAYTGRNMEYKQPVPYCFGGFAKDLKPYIFLADEKRFDSDFMSWNIGPSFIRSLPTELDRFFNVLNGYSFDTYYHFSIVNIVNAEFIRPMAATPGILNG